MKRIRVSFYLVFLLLASVFALKAQDVVITNVSSTLVTCGSGSDGTITVTVSGGIGQYSYLIVRGALPLEFAGPMTSNIFTFTNHPKYSNYVILVSDEDENTEDGFIIASIGGPDPIVISSASASNITCSGTMDGRIDVSATGEGGNFIFDLTGPVNQTNETGVFTGLPQGDYTVEVSDKDGCPDIAVSPILTIIDPSPVSIVVDAITNIGCYGDNTGSISITPGGGTPGGGSGYTYSWSGPNGFTSSQEDISNLEAGDYFINVFDANACIHNLGPIPVVQSPELTAVLTASVNATCFGGNDGGASLTPGGGTGPYTFSWDGQATGFVSVDQNPANLVADTYYLSLTDAAGCSKTFPDFVIINEPAVLNANVGSTTDVTCPGGSDGSAEIVPSGGTAPYTFFWTGVTSPYTSSDKDPVNMPADDFNLRINDANGCLLDFPGILTIAEPLPVTVLVNSTTEVSCFGGNDGAANISLSGGTPPYTIVWTGIGSGLTSSGETPVDLVADTYNMSVTDGNGCLQDFPSLLTLGEPADITVSVDNITGVSCNGAATGSIAITPSGGTPLLSFSWSGPNGFTSTLEDISNLEAGNYNLTISDANGCVKDFLNVATVPTNTTITATFILSQISCNGAADGAIAATIAGGTPNYSFSWTGPSGYTSGDEDISGLLPGSYQLTLTDALTCSEVMPAQLITQPTAITASTTQIDIDCFGAANGSIDLSSSGGVTPHSFAWTGVGGFTANTEDISNLEPGSYSVSITDASSCVVSFPDIVSILQADEILVAPVKTDISCGGLTDGTIDISVNGGVLPYVFAWTGPGGFVSGDEDLSGLAAGNYDLSISDGNSCLMNFPALVNIIEPTPISATLISQVDILCNGDASGSILIDVSGGTAPLIFAWTDGSGAAVSTDEDPVNLVADTYSLTITDLNGCIMAYPNMLTLAEPPPIVSLLSGIHISCFGDSDGSINVATSGGNGLYVYSINGDLDASYQAAPDFTALGPDFYTIWTRDAMLCVVSDTITILEPTEIQILGETSDGVNLCFGDSQGSISIDLVSGGIQPYEYSINGGLNFFPTNVFSNLPAGSYQTVVRDASGCLATGNLNEITEPALLVIDSYAQVDVTSCFDAPEGRITLNGAGGTAPYSYILNTLPPSPGGDFQNLPGGTYLVSITDQNSCFLDTTVVILAPAAVVVDNIILTDISGCAGDATGAVSIAGSGGTGSITYSMDGGAFQGSGLFSGLLAGVHTLTLKDLNDCSLDTVFTLIEPSPMVITSELISPITCNGAANGSIEIVVSGGTAPLKYTLNPGGTTSPTGLFSGLTPGSYTIAVNDDAGCGPVDSSPLILSEPPLLLLDSISDKNISCNGTSDGEIIIYISGGVPPYEYSVDNKATWGPDSMFANLTPGTYEVHARDGNLCIVNAGSFTMVDPPLMTISTIVDNITGCYGDTDGSIDISSTGGIGVHAYSLDGISFTASGLYENLLGGDYTAYVRDEGGCVLFEALTINQPEQVLATIVKRNATIGSMGSINITESTGGIPPYAYTIWGPDSTFSTETLYTDLELGTYHPIVRDQNGCIYEEIVYILDIQPLQLTVNLTDVSCFGELDGVIGMLAHDADGAVEYSIDSGLNFVPTAIFENLAGNTVYHLVARDSAGKTFTGTVPISEPRDLTLSSNITHAECDAFSETGAIDIRASGGIPAYAFVWEDGSTTEDRTDLVPGSYTVQTTDSNSCTRTDTIVVNSQVSIEAFAGNDTTICHGASIQLNGQGGHTPSWSPISFLSDPDIADPIAMQLTETTTYVFTITEETSPYGCFATDTLTISVFPLTGIEVTKDTFIFKGNYIELEALGGPFSAYRWEPETGLDNPVIAQPVASPMHSTLYTVYALNEYGCEESDSVFVEVLEDIMAYNVFSPNGDGINDFFEIRNAERFPEIVVEVYSRWGDLLYSAKGYDSNSLWDGTARGNPAPMGTYYFVIIPYSGALPITGNVTIIR